VTTEPSGWPPGCGRVSAPEPAASQRVTPVPSSELTCGDTTAAHDVAHCPRPLSRADPRAPRAFSMPSTASWVAVSRSEL